MLKPETKPVPIRLYNSLVGVIKPNNQLSFDRLISRAMKKSGLEDFGKDFNDQPLRQLIESINREARLNPFGFLMIREKLVSQLENRLWVEHWVKKYPQILEQETLPIILITGLQRTGTTKMQRLLSDLPGARKLSSWEALYPAPIGKEQETGKRISQTRRNEKAVKFISPTFHAIHPIHTYEPEEDVLLLDVNFMSTSAEAILHVPSFSEFLEKQNQIEAYEFENRLLKVLQWQHSNNYWVLKSPHHLQYLQEFKTVFPNSSIVWMHRNPEHIVPSFLSMLYYSRGMFSDEVDKSTIKKDWLPKIGRMLKGGKAFAAKNPKEVVNVSFNEFMASESATLDHLSKSIECIPDLSNHSYASKDKPYKSTHRYNLQDWDLTTRDIDDMFAEYNLPQTNPD